MNGCPGCPDHRRLSEVPDDALVSANEFNRRRWGAPPDGGGGSYSIVQRWRDAVERLKIVSDLAAERETQETMAALDLADAEATLALEDLADAGGLHRELLRAQADALEWQMQAYGALSDNPHQEALGRSIVAKLRAISGCRTDSGNA